MACGGTCSCSDCKCDNCPCKTASVAANELKDKCSINENSSGLSPEIEAKLNTLLSIGEECITREELALLLQKKPNFTAYDGFEPSGRMHIAQVQFGGHLSMHIFKYCCHLGYFESHQC